jgi:MFS family permease
MSAWIPRVSAVAEGHGIKRYRVFLAIPFTRSLIIWGLVARMPLGMAPLALLFLARAEGASYAAAGLVVAGYGLALAGGALVSGRMVDRRGPTRVLAVRAVAYPVCLALVIVLALSDAPIAVIGAAAAAAGVVIPPVSSSVRSVWPQIVPDELRSTAYSLEAAFQEIIFVVGPLAAASLAAIDPALAVGVTGVATLIGTLVIIRLPPMREAGSGVASGGGLLGAMETPGIRTMTLYALTVGIAFGVVEVSMPAFAEGHGARELGGLALATFSAGSLIGGVLAGALREGDDRKRFLRFAALLGVSLFGFQAAWSIPTLCVVAFFAGLPIAPAVAALYGLVDRVAPPWAIAESFAWFGTSVALGIAVGTAIGGALVDGAGIRWALALGPATALIGAGWAYVRRATLTRVETAT